jgi:NAD(P)H-hydrate epimerase
LTERNVFGRPAVAVPTASEAAALDREARERGGIPERVLMENAGRAAALIIDQLYPRGRVIAAIGSGHNGGDGLVLLRTLRAWGREVAYLPVGSRPPDLALAHGHEIPLAATFDGAEVLVDALLGTGSSGAPREPAATLIRALNASGRPVVALDLPSGVDASTGAVPGAAVRAELTVTFGWPKRGLLFHPARAYCGRLVAVEIGFPPLPATPWGSELITPEWARARLPIRPPDAYKSVAGRLLVVAGREGMAGAALVAAQAALRAGAGYLWLASVAENRGPLQAALPEAIFIDRADRAALREAAESATALLVGPGIGVDDVARELLIGVLEAMPGKPVLLDADALTLLGRDEAAWQSAVAGRELVLTPHPGEMRRLTGLEIPEIVADPVGVARDLAERMGCVVVLKGMPSVVAAPGEPVLINTVGSSDLARAGMGDQLAGVIAAFLAASGQEAVAGARAAGERAAGGIPARTAAGLGLFYAGRAADLAGRGRSLGPRDVSEQLDRAFADPGPAKSPLGLPFITFDQPARW